MRTSHFLGGLALAAVSVGAAAQPSDFAAGADAILESAYRADEPGAAAIVMRGGEVIWSGGRGLADTETGRPITPGTVFRTGSITKQIVAATVLTLVQEGQVSLDDPLSKFFPDWPEPSAHATVRQLLNHTSGIQDYTGIPGFMLSEPTLRPTTTADLLAVIRNQPSPSEPGARWQYNNSGYVILGAIVEQVTGKSWHEAVAERIARPLGLTTLAYAPDVETDPATARPYGIENGRPVPARGVHMSVAHAAGALVSSVGDLAKWAKALHRGRVVAPELYALMTSPAPLADGTTAPYGFGLRMVDVLGRPAFRHGGAGRGIDTESIYVPSDDLFVAVFSNSDVLEIRSTTVAQRLAALALGKPFPVLRRADVPVAAIEPLFGLYRAEEGADFRFFARGDKLFLARGDDEVPLVAAGDDRFFMDANELRWVSFVRAADGAHVVEVHRPDGTIARGTWNGPVPPPLTVAPEILANYVGAFTTEGPPIAIALGEDGWLTVSAAGQTPMPLRPVSDTEFRADAAGLRIVFHPENGATDKLTIYAGARELHGTRTAP